MTDAQREAIAHRLAEGITRPMRDLSPDLYGEECDDAISAIAAAALDALLSEFVVLHRDDVETEVERAHIDFRDDGPWQVHSATSKDFPFCERTVTHHATRWEPITKEDT